MRLLHCLRGLVIVLCTASMLVLSCGIETVVFLEKPRRLHDTSYQTDPSQRYCHFKTADTLNTAYSAGYFQGTEIYYRIYEREADCQSDKAGIDRYNDSNPAGAAQYLQDTKKYCRLTTSTFARRPLIGTVGSDIEVRFRLQDYDSIDTAQLITGASLGVPYQGGGASLGIPHRGLEILDSSKRSFDKRNITADDVDVQKSFTSSRDDFWYVNFYAVSYGYDAAFKTLYSSLGPLGYIKINKDL